MPDAQNPLLDYIKNSLRRTDDDLDDSLQADIDAAINDMQRVGVDAADSNNPLIYKCVDLFVKWQIDYLSKGDQFAAHYQKLRDSLSLSESYKESGGENA